MSLVTLHYQNYRADGIFGKLCFDGKPDTFCVTLSHAYEQDDGSYEPIVAPAIYTCKRGYHELANGVPFQTFEILGVNGHSGLLFHAGNWNSDSHGCTLLGKTVVRDAKGQWMITNSKDTFNEFMKLLEGKDEFELEIIDDRDEKISE